MKGKGKKTNATEEEMKESPPKDSNVEIEEVNVVTLHVRCSAI